MMKKEKWELQITEDVKIQHHDKYNFTVLKYEEKKNTNSGEMVSSWKIQAYCSSFRLAVNYIMTNDLLVDHGLVETLQDYLDETQKQVETLKHSLKKVKVKQ